METVKVQGAKGEIYKFPVENCRIEISDLKRYFPGATALTYKDLEGCINTVRSEKGHILLPQEKIEIFDAFFPGNNSHSMYLDAQKLSGISFLVKFCPICYFPND